MPGVQGRVAVVTGAGQGLGRQHALRLAEHGARLVVNDLGSARDGSGHDTKMADHVVEEIRSAGGQAVASYDDVADPQGAERIVATAVETFGTVEIVVNNAGILRDVSFRKMTDDDWDAVLKVHLYGTYHVTHAAWPHLREAAYGRVIVTSSTTGLFGNFGQANYGAAKMGLVGLINTLALEGVRYHITANAVVPLAATRMTEDVLPQDTLNQLDPAYVAPAVVHLASEECLDNGLVVLAGGGRYHRLALCQSPGVRFDEPPTVESLAARWEDVTDMEGAELAKPPL